MRQAATRHLRQASCAAAHSARRLHLAAEHAAALSCHTRPPTFSPTLPPPPLHLAQGKERYVFFSFPHIAIDSEGEVGAISRPNRAGASSACGALIACTHSLREEGLQANMKVPGVHDPLEPE